MFRVSRVIFSLLGAIACLALSGVCFAQPVGTAKVDGVLTETSTGNKMVLKFTSVQSWEIHPGPHQDDQADGGGRIHAMFRGIWGIPIMGCSVHGPTIPANYDIDVNSTGWFPLQSVECGQASSQNVSVDGCIVKASFHAYVHSDSPRINYLGTTTVDITVQKTNSKVSADLTVHTPKGPIQVSGKLEGTVNISSCQ